MGRFGVLEVGGNLYSALGKSKWSTMLGNWNRNHLPPITKQVRHSAIRKGVEFALMGSASYVGGLLNAPVSSTNYIRTVTLRHSMPYGYSRRFAPRRYPRYPRYPRYARPMFRSYRRTSYRRRF